MSITITSKTIPSICAKYTSSTTTIGTTVTDIVMGTPVYDPFGIYNSSTGVATISVPGKYAIKSSTIGGTASSTTVNQGYTVYVYKNGTQNTAIGTFIYQVTGTSLSPVTSGSTTIDCAKNDTLKLVGQRDTNISSFSLSGSAVFNSVSIERIGD